ncbi:MAG: hypothetical protein FWD08_00200 [Alphaproteobacteria bacterium]|nr:hypothetical protein [Alphaproteobacteria bacterium]
MKLDRIGLASSLAALLDEAKRGSPMMLIPLSDIAFGVFSTVFDDPVVATDEFDRFAVKTRRRIETELSTRNAVHRCPACGKEKPARDFYLRRRKGSAVGRMLACKTCHIERISRRRAERKGRAVHEHA